MTREEAIKTWLPIISMSIDNMPELKEAFDMAIKALEQEPKSEWEQDHAILKAYSDGAKDILDKIRTEIEQDAFEDVKGSKFIFVNRVNQIIDKYKAEIEPQESEE